MLNKFREFVRKPINILYMVVMSVWVYSVVMLYYFITTKVHGKFIFDKVLPELRSPAGYPEPGMYVILMILFLLLIIDLRLGTKSGRENIHYKKFFSLLIYNKRSGKEVDLKYDRSTLSFKLLWIFDICLIVLLIVSLAEIPLEYLNPPEVMLQPMLTGEVMRLYFPWVIALIPIYLFVMFKRERV